MSAQRLFLAVENLEVHYGHTRALRSVSLDVARGEIVGVVGPNGAGKSTLMLAIAGAIPATSGKVSLDGESLLGLRPERIVKRGISLVPEGRHTFARLTVAENLEVGMVGRDSREGLDSDLALVFELFPGLADSRNRAAGLLSGGQQQQLAIAHALVGDPEILLLDEPSLGLAPIVVAQVFRALQRLRDAGKTILIVEQRIAQTLQLVDRVYVLSAGLIRLELPASAPDVATRINESYFGAQKMSEEAVLKGER